MKSKKIDEVLKEFHNEFQECIADIKNCSLQSTEITERFRNDDNKNLVEYSLCLKSLSDLLTACNKRFQDCIRKMPSLLRLVCKKGMQDECSRLISLGAEKNAKNLYDESPLSLAVSNGHKEIVEILLTYKANVNATEGDLNLAHLAILNNHGVPLLPILIKAGVDINAANQNGNTPIASAVMKGDVKSFQILKTAGAKLELPKSDESILSLLQRSIIEYMRSESKEQVTQSARKLKLENYYSIYEELIKDRVELPVDNFPNKSWAAPFKALHIVKDKILPRLVKPANSWSGAYSALALRRGQPWSSLPEINSRNASSSSFQGRR